MKEIEKEIELTKKPFQALKEQLSTVVIGQPRLIERMMIALLTGGHLLLEGLPGLAKTLAITSLAKSVEVQFKRVQFTPDLLPADLIGTAIYDVKEGSFRIKQGPIFTNILLADEINRAPGKVQSALLEAMQERQVTIGGETFLLEKPYLVIATQNPVEQEGTYPLPEAQIDRFLMKVRVHYPTFEDEHKIVQRYGMMAPQPEIQPILSPRDILQAQSVVDAIYVDEKILDYILQIVFATREPRRFEINLEGMFDFGASPRASLALLQCAKAHAFLHSRSYVTPHDVKSIAVDVLRHRLRLSYQAEADELQCDDLIEKILSHLFV